MNWGDFFSMGGRGFYVWGSYGVSALFLLIELFVLKSRKKSILKKLDYSKT